MTDSMEPGKLVRHIQNPSYTYDEYLICIGLGPSISSVICKNLSYSGPSYPSSPVRVFVNITLIQATYLTNSNTYGKITPTQPIANQKFHSGKLKKTQL